MFGDNVQGNFRSGRQKWQVGWKCVRRLRLKKNASGWGSCVFSD